MKVTSERRYALFQAARDSDYVKKVHGGYFNVFVKAFAEEGETWDLFRVVEGEFPDMNELHKYDGFSLEFASVIRFCAERWVGKVGKSYSGWDIGIRRVRIVKDVSACRFPGELTEIPSSLSIIECHQDEVWEVPSGAEVIAFSDKTGVEMFAIGDHILGIQGHPEYTKDILHSLIDRLLNDNSIESAFAENAKVRLEIAEPDRKSWEKICRNFLKGR
ncbi:hypothetical protein OIU84_000728 [Salix udensis]|uniref:Glutamine amidotransferase domain-containing protein n=1 Tax=Salix udensis TaxID=889485 RepID=A0AAD6PPA5_9ROSI|nr:hypothetical protein OIU84_000728 [Salix udensis]